MSKTVEQLLEEVKANEQLQKDLSEALQKDKNSIISFMRNNGCDASIEEAKSVAEAYGKMVIDNGELTPDQLEAVQGGLGVLAGTCFVVATLLACAGIKCGLDAIC